MFRIEKISKKYKEHQVLRDFSLDLPVNQITVLIGPSAWGKTTLLNIIAGLQQPDSGTIEIPERVSYLFQEPRLLPWLTVRENIRLVLRDAIPEAEIEETIDANLKAAAVAEYGDFYPKQLSGGLRQRAALARAFAFPAELLLMDEPFKSLDLKIRYKLLDDFEKMLRCNPRTVLAVTHDVSEAVRLGDVIVVLGEDDTDNRIKRVFHRDEKPTEQEILKLILE